MFVTFGASMLCRYDVELFQKIEKLTGQEMEQYTPEKEDVLLLMERTNEAQRIANMQVLSSCLYVLVHTYQQILPARFRAQPCPACIPT